MGNETANWYPLKLTTRVQRLVFGGRALAERFGRGGLPDGRIGETWEVSDVGGEMSGEVTSGPLAGRSLRLDRRGLPEELMGRGWRGEYFPVLTKRDDHAADGRLQAAAPSPCRGGVGRKRLSMPSLSKRSTLRYIVRSGVPVSLALSGTEPPI